MKMGMKTDEDPLRLVVSNHATQLTSLSVVYVSVFENIVTAWQEWNEVFFSHHPQVCIMQDVMCKTCMEVDSQSLHRHKVSNI